MSFPQSFMDEVRARNSLNKIISRHVKLTRKGHEQTGLCPFHSEKTPSFTVSEEKGFFHCFGCGAHGDIFGFTMRLENLTFPEAVEKLAIEAGLTVPRDSPKQMEEEKKKAGLQAVMERATEFFQSSLHSPEGAGAIEYLKSRGLNSEVIGLFRLGYAPNGGRALLASLLKESIPGSVLEQCGLVVDPGDGRSPYDRFRDRVMFPITDERDRVIAFGARTLRDIQPKYLNSPDTPLFNKGRILYGLAKARSAAAKSGDIIVVEGYMDVIALSKVGIQAVAALGTAVTEIQLGLLWRLVSEPIFCFDGDNAGMRAVERLAERALPLLQPGKSVRFVFLPQGEDPDTIVSSGGREAMDRILKGARPLSEIVWEIETKGASLDTPERIAGLQQRLEGRLKGILDRRVQYQYMQSFRSKVRDLARLKGNRQRHRVPDTPSGLHPRKPPEDLALRRESMLLSLFIQDPQLLDIHAEDLAALDFRNVFLDDLRQEILKLYAVSPDLDSDAVVDHLTDAGLGGKLGGMLSYDGLFLTRSGSWEEANTENSNRRKLASLVLELIDGLRLESAQRRYNNEPNAENLARLQECKLLALNRYRGNV
ncbi:MAG: DNA primase [Rhodospirillaceae bacterium]